MGAQSIQSGIQKNMQQEDVEKLKVQKERGGTQMKTLETQIDGEHYKELAIEPWVIIEKNNLDYWEGNALKYLLRWKQKNGVVDLRKAKHYIDYLIEREETSDATMTKQKQSGITPEMLQEKYYNWHIPIDSGGGVYVATRKDTLDEIISNDVDEIESFIIETEAKLKEKK